MKDILIVDDNKSIREILLAMLKISFPKDLIIEAVDGRMAMSIVEKVQPDIVISDIDMPERDGLSMLAESKERFPQIPFIMMSGSSGYRDVAESLGAVFMEKPFSLATMVKVVKEKIKK